MIMGTLSSTTKDTRVKTNPWMVATAAISFLSLQIIIFQLFAINRLHEEIRISEKAKSIENDQSQELMYQLTQMKAEMEAAGTRQFVAGVVEAVSKPDHFTEIWHNGYDRGAATTQYADSLDVEKLNRAVQTSIKN
jgi:hypothetical protein